jgi:hypothetical protein
MAIPNPSCSIVTPFQIQSFQPVIWAEWRNRESTHSARIEGDTVAVSRTGVVAATGVSFADTPAPSLVQIGNLNLFAAITSFGCQDLACVHRETPGSLATRYPHQRISSARACRRFDKRAVGSCIDSFREVRRSRGGPLVRSRHSTKNLRR